MPLSSQTFTLSDVTPTRIVDADNMPQDVHLHNMSKSSNNFVHIGTSDMTLNGSIHLDPGESITLRLFPKDELHALSNPSGLVVGVMTVRQNK